MHSELRMYVQLLVAYNGRQRVLEELASIEDVDLATLEREIEQVRAHVRSKTPARRKPRRRKTALESTKDVVLGDDIRPVVESLVLAYEGKEFLPDLWRVRQFLESHGIAASNIRSRREALPRVIGVLSRLESGELETLATESKDKRGDLSVLTDHILGPVGGKQHTHPSADNQPRDAVTEHGSPTQ